QEPEPSQDSDTTSRAPTGGLSEVSCFPDWECGNWSECFPQGFRYRECTDSNNCSSTFLRPEVSELCDYTPTCDDEIQNGNETGIDCGGKCPQMCELKPTCSDAIQNQNEQGVDCGGECPPCQLHESCYDGLKNQDEEGVDCGGTCERKCPAAELPTILQKINWKILIWTLLLLIVTGVGSYYVYEHRYQFLKEIKKIRKLIKRKLLLAAADKGKILLDRLDKLEQELANILPQKALGELSEIIDTYLMLLLETEEALTHKEIVLKLKESELETPLKEILKSYYIDMTRLEFSKEKPSSTFVQALIYEAKSLVNTTLKTKKKTPIRFEILSQIIPKTQSDLNYQKIVGLNLGFLNNNVAEIKEGYTKVCSDIASKNIKSKYAINSVKRFHKLYNFKNAQKK
ncbi:hypothetical protein GOV08_04600, partial [Candidatus Woesearchaeota archaeon]|nr:hypothetical protein [Candidatus Woesearchaeota archaeon]